MRRSLRKNLRRPQKAVSAGVTVSSLGSILEDEETLSHGDIDKDMAYAVHINFDAHLGDDAAVVALFGDDTDEGILDKTEGREQRTLTQLAGPGLPLFGLCWQGLGGAVELC